MTFTLSTAGPQRGDDGFPGPLAAALMILAFFGALGVYFAVEEQRRLDDPVLKAERGEITITSPESLIAERKLATALTLIERAAPAGSTVESLRLTPTLINASVAHPDGRRYDMAIDPALELTQAESGAVRGEGPQASEIDPALPSQLIDRTERKLRLKPADLDYVTLTVSGADGEPSWGLYYAEPPLDNDATAAFDGTDLRLLGTPSAAQRQAERDREAEHEALLQQMAERRAGLEDRLREAAGR